jgi:hypothetical protein
MRTAKSGLGDRQPYPAAAREKIPASTRLRLVRQIAIRSAILLGAEQVVAIDRLPERLSMAEAAGARRSTSRRRAPSTGSLS